MCPGIQAGKLDDFAPGIKLTGSFRRGIEGSPFLVRFKSRILLNRTKNGEPSVRA